MPQAQAQAGGAAGRASSGAASAATQAGAAGAAAVAAAQAASGAGQDAPNRIVSARASATQPVPGQDTARTTDGQIDHRECLHCLDCLILYTDDKACPPLAKERKVRERNGQPLTPIGKDGYYIPIISGLSYFLSSGSF